MLIYSLENKDQMSGYTFQCLVLYLSNLTLDFSYHAEFCKDPLFQLLQKIFQQATDPFNVRNFLLLFYNLLNNPRHRGQVARSHAVMDRVLRIVNSYEHRFPQIKDFAILILSNLSRHLQELRVPDKRAFLQSLLAMVGRSASDFRNIVGVTSRSARCSRRSRTRASSGACSKTSTGARTSSRASSCCRATRRAT